MAANRESGEAAGPLSWEIIAITIAAPCGAGMVVAAATDEARASLPAVVESTESAEDSCDDSVKPTVNAATAPGEKDTPRVVRDKRMAPFGFSVHTPP